MCSWIYTVAGCCSYLRWRLGRGAGSLLSDIHETHDGASYEAMAVSQELYSRSTLSLAGLQGTPGRMRHP